MKRVGITEAKNGLSALLDRVRAGETVVILYRGHAIARIEPLTTEGDSRVARLERAGALRRPKRKLPRGFLDERPPAPARGASALETLLEERTHGR